LGGLTKDIPFDPFVFGTFSPIATRVNVVHR
jgi:hypothetical protein